MRTTPLLYCRFVTHTLPQSLSYDQEQSAPVASLRRNGIPLPTGLDTTRSVIAATCRYLKITCSIFAPSEERPKFYIHCAPLGCFVDEQEEVDQLETVSDLFARR